MAKGINVDFTNVESREIVPEGEYIVEVVKVEQREGNKGPYLNWELKVATGQFKGKKLWNVTSLSPNSLWVLRTTLDALGVKTIPGKFTFNPDQLVGLKMGVKLEHKTFDGKTRAKVIDVFPVSEVSTAEESDESDEEDEPDT